MRKKWKWKPHFSPLNIWTNISPAYISSSMNPLPFQVWPQRPRWPSSRLCSDTTALPPGYTLIQLIIHDLNHFRKDIFKRIHIVTQTQVVSVVQTVWYSLTRTNLAWQSTLREGGVGPERVLKWRSYISLVLRDIFFLHSRFLINRPCSKTIM